ncbi:hypothetical protein [Sorangium sp. So ce131]|uniref:hypothetical protein n=1 Tax=Sorangium sp. So ce131 TaxID=3133282 RepID=UPI003F6358D0
MPRPCCGDSDDDGKRGGGPATQLTVAQLAAEPETEVFTYKFPAHVRRHFLAPGCGRRAPWRSP